MRRFLILVCLAACGEPSPVVDGGSDAGVDSGADSGTADTGADGGGPIDERFLNVLETPADLYRLDTAEQLGVKFLAPTATATPTPPLTAACYFQNMNQFQWHLQFLQSFEELKRIDYQTYLNWVLRPASRRLWGGYVKAYPSVIHPETQHIGVITFSVYSDPGTLRLDDIVAARAILAASMPFAVDFLVFLPEGPDQKALAQANLAELRSRGVAVIFPEQLIDGVSHQVYSAGEGYGTLRIVPAGQTLDDFGPRDIVIVESAPNDISVVQGLITRDPQNTLSHTNLRLIEKGIPNVAVPAIYEAPYVAALRDSLVHLVVDDDTFLLEPAALAAAEAFWASRRPDLPPIQADLAVTELKDFGQLRHPDAIAYGAKAANLGELFSILPADNRDPGFGIPFARYDAFQKANGIDTMVQAALADPRMRTDSAFKREQLIALRAAIRAAPFPGELLDEIESAMDASFGAGAATLRTKFRSSTNVEDLDALTGAGLYESRAGCLADDRDADTAGPSLCLYPEYRADLEAQLAARTQELTDHPERASYLVGIIDDLQDELTNEKTVANAVRRTWASLWTERAFDEREYYAIDHTRAYMAIAVNQSFTLERASAVAITGLIVDTGDPLYRLNSQIGSSSVVRPDDPTEVAEVITFRRTASSTVADVHVEVHSTLLPETEQVWTTDALEEAAQALFTLHDHFNANVYPALAPLSIDVELKWTRDGRVVIKQARPFVSFDP